MKIPIFNSIYDGDNKYYKSKININLLNDLNLNKVDKKYPLIKILKILSNNNTLFETY